MEYWNDGMMKNSDLNLIITDILSLLIPNIPLFHVGDIKTSVVKNYMFSICYRNYEMFI
jgi:hypothetical protein